jgi:spermidine synthase
VSSRARTLLVLALFLASGAAGLVYEVVWMRLLALTLSVTVYAVTTVLCAFMAGLALGAAVGGRIAPRVRRPLVAYGVAELGIGAVGLATPSILFNLAPAYVWIHDTLGGSQLAFTAARFVLAFAVLLVPCTLMGATLPLLGRATIARPEAIGRGAGALYAVNTLGAVVGVVAAGFVLLPWLGLWATSAVAAALNVAVGVTALALAWQETEQVDAGPARTRAPLPWSLRLVCLAFALSGFTALGYEVLWTRALEQFTHNSTYAYSAMLATFLLGLALGSALAGRAADRLRRPLLAFAVLQALIAISVLGGLVLYARFDRLVPATVAALGGIASWHRVIVLIFGEAAAVLFVTTLLFGATFPVVVRVVVERVAMVGERIAVAYVANTVGSIAGAVVVGFVLLPALGMRGAFVALMLTNLAVSVAVALGTAGRARVAVLGTAGVTALAALLIVPHGLFEQSYVRRFGKLLFYREEVTDTVMVTEDVRGGRMIRFGDGRGTAGTMSVRDDRMYAHIPLVLHPAPRRVLNICFGVGNSLSAVLAHPVERVDAVELSPGVVDAAPFFRSTNHDPLADPRAHLTIADGRNFLLASHESYDVIRLDPPELHTAGVVNLYTREFYELARAHLRPGGIFSIWVNIVMTPEADLRLVVRTLASVFPHVSVWRGPLRYSWVINGSDSPLGPDLSTILRHYDDPRVRADLAAIGAPDPFAFLAHFVLAHEGTIRFAGTGPLVTDDHTRLDFSVPRSIDANYGFSNANSANWLVDLMGPEVGADGGLRLFFRKIRQLDAHQEPVLPHLTNVEAAGLSLAEVRARLAAAGAPLAGGLAAPGGTPAPDRSS